MLQALTDAISCLYISPAAPPSVSPRIPVPDTTTSCFLSLPSDLLFTIVKFGDIDSLGILAFTCHTLYATIFERVVEQSCFVSEICSRLIEQQNLTALKSFCKLAKKGTASVELKVTADWDRLSEALCTIQTAFPITGLLFQGEQNRFENICKSLPICSSLKKLEFKELTCQTFCKLMPENLPVEEIQFISVEFADRGHRENYSLAAIASHFAKLKRFIFQRCSDFTVDFEKLTSSSNSLEFFSHSDRHSFGYFPKVLNEGNSWKDLISFETTGRDFEDYEKNAETSGVCAYFLACCYYQKKDFQKAESFLRKSIILSPRLVHSRELLGELLLTRAPNEAEELLREGLTFSPEYPPFLTTLGKILVMAGCTQGRIQEGIQFLDRAYSIGIQTRVEEHLFLLAKTLCQLAPQEHHQRIVQLIRMISSKNLLKELMESTSHPLAGVKYAVLGDEIEKAQMCRQIQEECIRRPNLLGLLVSTHAEFNEEAFTLIKANFLPEFEERIKRTINRGLFGYIDPWIMIFADLKASGTTIVPLLTDFLSASFQIPGQEQLFQFLSDPNELISFLPLLVERTDEIQWSYERDYKNLFKNNDQVFQKFCEMALQISKGQWSLFIIANSITSPALLPTKRILLFRILEIDPTDIKSALQLTDILIAEKNRENVIKKILMPVAKAALTGDWSSTTVLKLHQILHKYKILPELQQQLFKKYGAPLLESYDG